MRYDYVHEVLGKPSQNRADMIWQGVPVIPQQRICLLFRDDPPGH